MLRSSLCDYRSAYIRFEGTITVKNTAAQGQTIMAPIKKQYLKVGLHLLNA